MRHTTRMDRALADHRSDILSIARTHGARAAEVSGSRARGQARFDSDVDMVVSLEPGRSLLDLIAIKQDVEDLLGLQVDVLKHASVSPYLRDGVRRDAMPLMPCRCSGRRTLASARGRCAGHGRAITRT